MEKKVASIEDTQNLTTNIINYALEHKFTKSNIEDAVSKAMNYMDKNAILREAQTEAEPHKGN